MKISIITICNKKFVKVYINMSKYFHKKLKRLVKYKAVTI